MSNLYMCIAMMQIQLRINFCDHYWLNDGEIIDSDPYVSALLGSQHKQNCEKKNQLQQKVFITTINCELYSNIND